MNRKKDNLPLQRLQNEANDPILKIEHFLG